jgi:hypothetical protein
MTQKSSPWLTIRLALAAWVSVVITTDTLAADPEMGVDFFETKIRPVLAERCYSCHSNQIAKPKGGLRLDSIAAIRTGGNSGAIIEPGNADESVLILAVAHTGDVSKMPPKKKLADAVIGDFRKWVRGGAPMPADPHAGLKPGDTAAAKSNRSGDWWSLRPIVRPTPPPLTTTDIDVARTPIDAFILAELRAKGLIMAPEADRRTLIRRLFFDLIGLPPTPEDVARFLADSSPLAYETLVDRLLDSPHFGERQARHWMDLVHFAETHGHDQDRIRTNAWPYRDYLIESFNKDTPYARFVEEQIAADILFPDEPRLTVALGMIASGPWDESSLRDIRDDSIDRQIGYYLDRDDMVATVISTFNSTTVHCARCHDHKFDPIPQTDYYALQAVFAGVDKAERSYDADPKVARLRASLTAQREALKTGDAATAAPFLALEIDGWLAGLPPKQLVFAAAADFAPDASHVPPGGPRPVFLLKRGDINHPSNPAEPGTLSCVAGLPSRFKIADPKDEGARRASLAKWVGDPLNPLTWRSIANRIWQAHFGRGLVDTPNDFGRMGSTPTHPELLDWLAAELLDNGGSLKRLHRLIVTSAAYRQAIVHDSRSESLDADNRLLWRQNRRRLDAESVRDAILQVSDRLDETMKGPSVRQFGLSPGVHVTPVVDYTAYDWDSPGSGRRGVYRFLFRTLPDPFMDALDGADASQLVAARNESITPLQALALLNNPFVLHNSEHLADRLDGMEGDAADRIKAAHELIFNREPTAEELREWTGYVSKFGLANFARILFNSNEFLFIN